MAKVTSKLQVTVPKALADQYLIRPGDDIVWEGAGETIRVSPARRRAPRADLSERLRLFDQATTRQQRRQRGWKKGAAKGRGWTREELYERDRAR